MKSVLIRPDGPYLVRWARVHGSTLALYGDVDAATNITVFALKDVDTITWNYKPVATAKSISGSLEGVIGGPDLTVTLPALADWKSSDSLPENMVDYDDFGRAQIGKVLLFSRVDC